MFRLNLVGIHNSISAPNIFKMIIIIILQCQTRSDLIFFSFAILTWRMLCSKRWHRVVICYLWPLTLGNRCFIWFEIWQWFEVNAENAVYSAKSLLAVKWAGKSRGPRAPPTPHPLLQQKADECHVIIYDLKSIHFSTRSGRDGTSCLWQSFPWWMIHVDVALMNLSKNKQETPTLSALNAPAAWEAAVANARCEGGGGRGERGRRKCVDRNQVNSSSYFRTRL